MADAPASFRGRRAGPRRGIQRKTQGERDELKRAADEAAEARRRAAAGAQPAPGHSRGRGSSRGRGRGGNNADARRVEGSDAGGIFGGGAGERSTRLKHATNTCQGEEEILYGGLEDILQAGSAVQDNKSRTAADTERSMGTGSRQIVGNEDHDDTPARSTRASRSSRAAELHVTDFSREDLKAGDFDHTAGVDIEKIQESSEEDMNTGEADDVRPARRAVPTRIRRKSPSDFSERPKRLPTDPDHLDPAYQKLEDAVDETEEPTDLNANQTKKDPPPSPEMKRKRGRAPSKSQGNTEETSEETAERMLHAKEQAKLFDLLANAVIADVAAHSSTKAKNVLRQPSDSNKLYLFQFPPILPMLIDPDAPVPIKEEPDVAESAANPVPKDKGPKIKKEEGVKLQAQSQANADLLNATKGELPGGRLGKLQVHKSGRVTLSWGGDGTENVSEGRGNTHGAKMEIKWGAEVDCLQDVVLVDMGEEEKKAYAFGQVGAKIVVIPDWEAIYK